MATGGGDYFALKPYQLGQYTTSGNTSGNSSGTTFGTYYPSAHPIDQKMRETYEQRISDQALMIQALRQRQAAQINQSAPRAAKPETLFDWLDGEIRAVRDMAFAA